MNTASAASPDPGLSPRRVLGFPLRIHVFVWTVFVVVVVLLAGLSQHYQGQNIWKNWTESRGLQNPTYSEQIHLNDVFRTRANTWSNLAYVLVGLYALALGFGDRRALRDHPAPSGGYVLRTPAMSFLFGTACCYLGFGSGLFHASLTHWGQQLDVASMYAPLLACIALHLGRWSEAVRSRRGFSSAPVWPALTVAVVVTSYLLYRYKWSMSAIVVLTTLILLVALLGLADGFLARRRMRFRWLGWSAAALCAGITCRQLDVAGKFTGPDAWFQGHAVWHTLTALSLACLYAYHRCEVTSNPTAVPSSRS